MRSVKINVYKGDVYRKIVTQHDGKRVSTLHVAGPNERQITEDKGKGRLLVYLLSHLGKTFDPITLANKLGVSPKTVALDANTFRKDFETSRHYEFVVEGIGREPRKYGIKKRRLYD